MDKRDLSATFRERLKFLAQRSGLNQANYARRIGIDRSALSQLMSGTTARLPRVETLMNIAADAQVSLDWLLGISQDEGVTGELRASFEIEESHGSHDDTLLGRWFSEAAGSKIRYVPAGIPDLLRSETLIAYEANLTHRDRDAQIDDTQTKIEINRRQDSDMEVCMPRHTLEIFARGLGVWADFPRNERIAQLKHMARLLDELYPSFRLYLYDGGHRYSIPYTIFGSMRAAVYVGDLYLVLNATDAIKTLTRHFDNLIRSADIHAHESAAFAVQLAEIVE